MPQMQCRLSSSAQISASNQHLLFNSQTGAIADGGIITSASLPLPSTSINSETAVCVLLDVLGPVSNTVSMPVRYILSEYLERAIAQAEFDKLEDGTFAGRIPACKGVVAFGATLGECASELRSTLEDWVILGLKLGHPMPVIEDIDLNKEPVHESVDSL